MDAEIADGPGAPRRRELARAKAWLDAFRPLPADAAEELRHRYEVRLAYHSTAIEGNTLTQSETQIVLEKGIAIGGKPLLDHLEVIGHRDALEFVRLLADASEPIGEREIREIHALVTKGQADDAGAYRSLDVRAAGTEFVYPSHRRLPELMAGFVAWLAWSAPMDPVERASEAHLRFVTIHPFRDGNGRVGRLLMNLLLLRAGYPIAVLPVERRAEYMTALAQAQTGGDAVPLSRLVEDAVESSLREVLQMRAGSSHPSEFGPEWDAVELWLRKGRVARVSERNQGPLGEYPLAPGGLRLDARAVELITRIQRSFLGVSRTDGVSWRRAVVLDLRGLEEDAIENCTRTVIRVGPSSSGTANGIPMRVAAGSRFLTRSASAIIFPLPWFAPSMSLSKSISRSL